MRVAGFHVCHSVVKKEKEKGKRKS